jgi:hypothetical protein
MRVDETAQDRQQMVSQQRQHDGHESSQQLPALKQQQFMRAWQHSYLPISWFSTRLRVEYAEKHGHMHETQQQHGALQLAFGGVFVWRKSCKS